MTTDSSYSLTRIGYRGYFQPCGVPYKRYTHSVPYDESNVQSYRGKPVYIQVGPKRRKAFHAFHRERVLLNEKCTSYWCTGGNQNMWAEDFPYAQLLQHCGEPDPSPYCYGDRPLLLPSQLAEEGSRTREVVISGLYDKLCSPRFDGAVFLAELDETLVGVKDLLQGSLKGLVRPGEGLRSIRKLLANPQDLWLWYRYALMPAILSVNDLLAAIKPQAKVDRMQNGKKVKPYTQSGKLYSKGWFSTKRDMEIAWSQEIKIGVGAAADLYWRIDPNEWGFSGVDLLRAGWERIPFSFIFDWFVKVGDWLTSLRNVDIGFAQTYATYAVESTVTITGGSMSMDVNPICKVFVMDRITGLEPPPLPIVDRRWRNVLRTIDSISLIVGVLKGTLNRH